MLFNDFGSGRLGGRLAISQPAHALVSGQILAAWAEAVDARVVLAAGQHDVAWLDWETAPAFDAVTGRPREFRTIGAAEHAPLWELGVERALAAWGRRVALMISHHGSTIYRRFNDRHRSAGGAGLVADERAAADYLERHRGLQDGWARSLGLEAAAVARDVELIAFADTLSLVLCGALPVTTRLPLGSGAIAVSAHPARADVFRLDPWPLATEALTVEVEARALPPSGRFPDEAAMQAWLADPARVDAKFHLVRG